VLDFFPNPASDILQLEWSDSSVSAALTDVYGKIIRHFSSTEKQIDVSHLSEGIYFLSVSNNNGDMSTSKLVVSNK